MSTMAYAGYGLKWCIPIVKRPKAGSYLGLEPFAVVVAPDSRRPVPSLMRGMFGVGKNLKSSAISGIIVRGIKQEGKTPNEYLNFRWEARERMKAG